ncbi:carboxyltransferase domain-containing protein [Devosia sp.]|uniref:5-oxoprolinase subunit B family protein n=1 Tax=Devosia sp. TaxID=1871048 RepID=UPI0026370C5C|nr:carboxyltransferase domain-containing protein [Devosia sp.]
MASDANTLVQPTIMPLGDGALLVRFGDTLSEAANSAAIAFARSLADVPLAGVVESVPNLVSVLLRYDPRSVQLAQLSGEVRLRLYARDDAALPPAAHHAIAVTFGGEAGPDLDAVASSLRLTPEAFVTAHNASALRVLATGFAPGFVYCGFHPPELQLPRRAEVRASVPAGSVLFAAGQTAIAATAIPTGWHVIGTTTFRNFDPQATPPTRMRAGDAISFEPAP